MSAVELAGVLADPFYGSAYELLRSLAAIEDAGYFAAGAEQVERAGVEWMSVPVEKICRRLASGERGDRPAVVLLTTGAFNPVHSGHVQLMESARAELEARGYFVAGGYLSPSHDSYVASKLGAQALPAVARLDLCQAVAATSEWLMASGWEALGVDRAINFTDVIVWTEEYLARHLGDVGRVEVVYVFGSDNVRFVRTFVARGMCVCVVRPGARADIARYAGDPLVEANPRILFARQSSLPASSSEIREGRVELMEERSRRRYTQMAAAPEAGRRGVYVLRDECGWEVEPWLAGRDRRRLAMAREWLYYSLARLMSRVHASAGTDVEFQRLRLDAQREQMTALAGRRVISIDAPISGDVNLAVSRRFAVSDAYGEPTLSQRPGSAPLALQIAEIPAGRYVLVDDDVSTGATLRALRGLLPAAVEIEEEFILFRRTQAGPELLDILDCRDFLAGSREGGLVIALPDGALARAPYCLPYVSASERASVPLAQELEFSRAVWQLNAEFFARIEPVALDEADPAFRRLMLHVGFAADSTMAAVCRWHAARCEQTCARAERWRTGP